MKGFIVQPSYKITDEKAYIHLYGKLENGESFLAIIERKAYFYIKEEDKEQAEKILPLEIDSLHKKITNFDNEPVIKLLFNSPKEMLDARKILQDSSIQSYEADISFPYRYMIDNNIKGCVDIEGNSYNKKEYNAANNTNYYVDKIFLNPKIKTCDFFPKLKILSFDIETSIKADKLYSISIYSDNYKKVLINKKGVFNNAESFESEKKVLERFIEIVKEIDPDIITGWNVVDFDLNILREMYKKHQINMNIGRDNTGIYLKLSDNFFQDSIAKIEGRMVIDGISILKQSFISLPDYKLETAAQHFIGHGKIFSGDERHSDIEKAYKKNPEKLIKYNLLDAKLVIDILEKSEALNLSIVRSKLTRMPLDRVKASIASLDSLYLEKLKQRGIVAPTGFTGQRDERIKGGYVKESNPGIYENILVFDFKSLYPSIIRTFNIDPYSFVPKEKLKKYNKEQQQNFIIAPNNAHFRNEEGILPEIIKELWSERDKAKKEKNKLRSNAIKILMNSFFGVLANPNCRFYSLEMANAITHFGQHLIKMTADEITKKEYSVIYGDSVGEDTEIIVKDVKEKIRYIKIHELFDKSIKKLSNRKEYSFQNKFKVLTIDNKGKSIFKKVKYVMRHKNIKQMYRIYLTNLWYIDVTEDHSLIGYINKQKNNKLKDLDRLVEVMPEDLGKMVKSLVTLKLVPNTKITTRNYVKELYELMGLFIGDGSFDRIKNNYYIHIAGGIDQNEIESKVLSNLKLKGIIRNYWLKKKGDICINGISTIKLFNNELRLLGKKKVPDFIFTETKENICSFLRGAFSSDGTIMIRNNKPIIRFTNCNVNIIRDIQKLLNLVGISNSMFGEKSFNKYLGKESNTKSMHIVIKDCFQFKKDIGFIMQRKNKRMKLASSDSKQKRTVKKYEFDISKIIKVEKINYKGYVYDIEVEKEHRFFANNILVHNTDSIFIDVKEPDYKKAEAKGKEICKFINNFFTKHIKDKYNRKSDMEIEFEKVYKKFFMPKVRGSDAGAKKRYAGIIEKEGKDELQFVGLEFVRSDWTEIAKIFQVELLKKAFNNEKVGDYIRKFIKDLKSGKHDSKLVYRKQIRKPVSEYTKTTPPHIQAARKIGREKTGIIDYVITEDGPEEAENVKHNVNYEHYIEKQLKPIADSVLEFFEEDFEDMMKNHKQNSLLDY